MQCYTELLPPTGVTHALAIPFLSGTAENLLIARTSVLQIFSVVSASPNGNGGRDAAGKLPPPGDSETAKLILEREYSLPGTITHLQRVKIIDSKSGGEAALLGFRNAKLSLIQWDPEWHGISTISIHYYERDDLTRSPWVPDLSSCGSILSVDPSSRCAIFNFGKRNLAILPFHQPGDDLAMDDYGLDMEDEDARKSADDAPQKDGVGPQTPYAASFVLPLAALEPTLLHPISLAFLHEYREPTFGILYSQIATSDALQYERKDVVFYSVFTLDLEQRASTTLLSVPRLPSDLFNVVALPLPVGGALLIGTNELVHVDQAGKTNAVGVNEFARQASAFSMTDQSDLCLRLEGCVVETAGNDTGDLLLILSNGDTMIVHFRVDGRSVSGISVEPWSAQSGRNALLPGASCTAFLGGGRIFVGSEDADSLLVGRSSPSSSVKKARLQTKPVLEESNGVPDEDQIDEDAYEEDLYSNAPTTQQSTRLPSTGTASGANLDLQTLDRLSNIGPIRDVALGRSCAGSSKDDTAEDLDLVMAHGSYRAGGLAVLRRELDPVIVKSIDIDTAVGIWSVNVDVNGLSDAASRSDDRKSVQYVIVAKDGPEDREESGVFTWEDGNLTSFKAPDFNPNAEVTIEIGALARLSRIVQVLKSEVRIYDAGERHNNAKLMKVVGANSNTDLGLSQIYPIWDEDTHDERFATHASFAGSYVAILRDDSTLLILKADKSGDLDEVELNGPLTASKYASCCLYMDRTGIFNLPAPGSEIAAQSEPMLFCLSSDCKLSIFRLSDQALLSVIEGVDSLQPILSSKVPRRAGARADLKEALVADLGDASMKSPHLILRTANDELVVYKPFTLSLGARDKGLDVRFVREYSHVSRASVPAASSKPTGERRSRDFSMRVLNDVAGLSTVFMPGVLASFAFKTAKSSPHVIPMRGGHFQSLCELRSDNSPGHGRFISLDPQGTIRICSLPSELTLDFPWPLRKIPLGEQVDNVTYSISSEMYVLGTSMREEFKLPEDDELHPEWRNEVMSFPPTVSRSSVKLVSSKTWSVIDSFPLSPAECVMAVKNINLEVSENMHERKDLIVVGTTLTKGEDMPARGCVYVFEVIQVVPDPEQPETDRKLKLVGQEAVKGAVTAISGIGGQGFLIVAQGQKCMVRGLKEDGSLLPVAFMDMQCYVSVIKELKGTGMCILGDAIKGLWFAGYSEDPYKMALFGKDPQYLEVIGADFLPDGKRLYIVVADSDCNLHVLQYDPEDPKSSNGDRLLARSKFHTGNFASSVTLLPRTPVQTELDDTLLSSSHETADSAMDIDSAPSYSPAVAAHHQVLITSQNGSIALVTPIPEESYRRLSALQSQLTNVLEHPCGLNPRAFRAVESDGTVGRGMLDGDLLRRWLLDLGTQRRAEMASRVGAEEWQIRGDLEVVGGGGLGYL